MELNLYNLLKIDKISHQNIPLVNARASITMFG